MQGDRLQRSAASKCRHKVRCIRDKWARNITVGCIDIEDFGVCLFDEMQSEGWFGTIQQYNKQSKCSWLADQVLNGGKPICQGAGHRWK